MGLNLIDVVTYTSLLCSLAFIEETSVARPGIAKIRIQEIEDKRKII
ncbi:MAG: hypothetical protein QMD01_06785 [Thermodesulfovibrionales bacterium]|nr:hypothetical protein [Thermodesulfovibrionales bacterium]